RHDMLARGPGRITNNQGETAAGAEAWEASMTRMGNRFVGAGLALAAGLMLATNMAGAGAPDPAAILMDGAGGENWPAFGRTYGEQHYSPLDQVNRGNVKDLGLAWYMDLPPGNSATGPLAVDGVIYFASGYSIVHAVRAED